MSKKEYFNFCEKLAMHTAPTLLGIKCASLVSLSAEEFDLDFHMEYFNRRASAKGLKSKILCQCGERKLMLFYSEKMLEKRLAEDGVQRILREYGYPKNSFIPENLERLSERIGKCGEFPHEIGIFLGYPTEDVEGFIKNKGENFKMCGCWKVYGSEEKAKRTFENYSRCRKFLCGKLIENPDIYRALKLS
ncbi:MAG: DUF3793 family protein [Muribaculaceae bacterium]|nr:DUF3793 family protein [Muribaculaceae bacterium]